MVVVLGLVMAVIGVPTYDHGRDQSKIHTHEFFLKILFYTYYHILPSLAPHDQNTYTTKPTQKKLQNMH